MTGYCGNIRDRWGKWCLCVDCNITSSGAGLYFRNAVEFNTHLSRSSTIKRSGSEALLAAHAQPKRRRLFKPIDDSTTHEFTRMLSMLESVAIDPRRHDKYHCRRAAKRERHHATRVALMRLDFLSEKLDHVMATARNTQSSQQNLRAELASLRREVNLVSRKTESIETAKRSIFSRLSALELVLNRIESHTGSRNTIPLKYDCGMLTYSSAISPHPI
jgi:hypothetical protein